mmetsp:Transcript_14702/g.16325  ORF Transcript_14702/g.16325 Transcript_14702/m.16325 type:complete len:233 (-) Transcript_14702:147-845(-)
MRSSLPTFKLILLGEGEVGKTSLFLRWTSGTFNSNHNTTKKAYCKNKKINFPTGERCELSIWDTAGQEKYHSLMPTYYRSAAAAMLMYDITSRTSFDRVQSWVAELRRVVGDDTKITLVILGNKMDLERSRKVDKKDAEAYAAKVGADHFEISCKHEKNLNPPLVSVVRALLKKDGGNSTNGGSTVSGGNSRPGIKRVESQVKVYGRGNEPQRRGNKPPNRDDLYADEGCKC